jgi:trehalose 6-phosphate phosphatase
MEYLFDAWTSIIANIKSSKRVVLLFDYDGTLTPIVERPEAAYLPEETRDSLNIMASKYKFKVGIISGRSLDDIQRRVNIGNIIYAGNHGLEIRGPDINFMYPLTDEVKLTFKILSQILNKALDTIKGTFIEDKGLTLSIHYRQVEDKKKEDEVGRVFERTVGMARLLGKIKTTGGKKVYEIRPNVEWHKGKAIELIINNHIKQHNDDKPLLIYLGDDLTDEDAFKFVEKLHGLSIFIGPEATQSSAGYFLKSTEEVALFIHKLILQI